MPALLSTGTITAAGELQIGDWMTWLAGRPAQRHRPFGQPVLQPRRLTVIKDLLARRLQVHHR
jgi:hypothetical protein